MNEYCRSCESRDRASGECALKPWHAIAGLVFLGVVEGVQSIGSSQSGFNTDGSEKSETAASAFALMRYRSAVGVCIENHQAADSAVVETT